MSFSSVVALVRSILFDRKYFWVLLLCVALGDACLTQLIVHFVPYTEIDWETYMIQVESSLSGQLDYSKISGPTGPLVYPAGHLRLHVALYWLTNQGKYIRFAQHIYSALYICSLVIVGGIYYMAGAPNWLLFMLPFSKRLHSIYVLRLFNDCWAVMAAQSAILCYQMGYSFVGTLLFSLGVSIKMSVLLYLPGLLVVLVKSKGLVITAYHLTLFALFQISVAAPFIQADAWSYFQSAFDFSRAFLYKWTVNWRFVNEATFLDPLWARGLLVGHITVLFIFGWFRWCRDDGGVLVVLRRALKRPHLPAGMASMTPNRIATILFTSNLIGITFSRSLHYQFYAWYAQQIPFLLWKTRYPLYIKLVLPIMIEYAWNVFPSTALSSAFLLLGNLMLLLGIWTS
ncbi:glycosyltransferase family 58 protein [Fistulina hepatica ATCC 64428]|nr:glycosyltransferase family 58 protein [Fistulina hepatica ATCC 64428]